jgi:hypothetical protein
VTFDQRKGVSAIVARSADDIVHYVFETAQSSGVFGDWSASVARAAETDPTIIPYIGSGGQTWGYVVRDVNFQVLLYTVNPSAGLSGRAARAGQPGAFTEHVLPRPPKENGPK